nr:MAG TPA: PORTAL PROTEIN [Caudoviricetes sp.]
MRRKQMLTIDRELLDADGIPRTDTLEAILREHDHQRERLVRLHGMYAREHSIMRRTRLKGLPNNRLVHDLPGYIATMAAGYLVGNPVRYTAAEGQEEAFTPVLEAYEAASVESVDAELAMDAAVYGKAAEVCYADAEARPRVAQLDARSAFVVYDDTVEHAPLLGITRRDTFDARLERTGEEVTLYTDRLIVHMRRTSRETPRETMREAHYFGGVPVVEYWNNAREEGDFEPVMGLIDAYDTLQSDRVNDKQQFTDAVFVLKGVGALGVDDTEEETVDADGTATAAGAAGKEAEDPSVRLRRTRTLFLPGDGADAQFVTKPDAESGNELLRMSLKSDIHKLCLVPDLTDEQFAGNVSGVAMRFKLLGLEQLTKIKERWFREGLRTRLRLFCAFLARKGTAALNAEKVQITFSRSLPVNDLEIAQTLATYQGMVPEKLLLAQVPFVEDAEAAGKLLNRERAEAAGRQREAFEITPFRKDAGEDDQGREG